MKWDYFSASAVMKFNKKIFFFSVWCRQYVWGRSDVKSGDGREGFVVTCWAHIKQCRASCRHLMRQSLGSPSKKRRRKFLVANAINFMMNRVSWLISCVSSRHENMLLTSPGRNKIIWRGLIVNKNHGQRIMIESFLRCDFILCKLRNCCDSSMLWR